MRKSPGRLPPGTLQTFRSVVRSRKQSVLRDDRAHAAEAIVQADLDLRDALVDVQIDRDRADRGEIDGPASEVDVVILDLGGPIVEERPLDAGADRPA